MVVFNHSLYYIYLEYSSTAIGQSQITLAKTSDLGVNWEYSRASYGAGFADKETFSIDENGVIYMAYDNIDSTSDDIGANSEQRLSRSFDGGATFIDNVTMSDWILPGYLGPYVVAAGSGIIYNVFSYIGDGPETSDIFFDKSVNGGETWGLDTDLNPEYNASSFPGSPNGAPSKSTIPSMSLDQNGVIFVVWADISQNIVNENWDVYMRYSETMGNTWSDRIEINENTEGNSWMPDLDIDSDCNVYIAYYDDNNNVNGACNLMYRVYHPADGSLSEEVQISTEETSSQFTRLGDYITIQLDSSDKFHVVWTDGREGILLNVYYATNKLPLMEGDIESSSITDSSSDSSKSPLLISWVIMGIILRFSHRKLKVKKY